MTLKTYPSRRARKCRKTHIVDTIFPDPFFKMNYATTRTLVSTASAEIAPVCAILGGFLAQDILKTLSGKDAPLLNYFLYNGLEGKEEDKARIRFKLAAFWRERPRMMSGDAGAPLLTRLTRMTFFECISTLGTGLVHHIQKTPV